MNKLNILLVEDEPTDQKFLGRFIQKISNLKSFFVASSGEEALDILEGNDLRTEPLKVNLVILDLNLPMKSGFDVLEKIKSDSKLKKIPVIILTSSTIDEDVIKSYDLGANSFVTKPDDLAGFEKIILEIERFWAQTASLP